MPSALVIVFLLLLLFFQRLRISVDRNQLGVVQIKSAVEGGERDPPLCVWVVTFGVATKISRESGPGSSVGSAKLIAKIPPTPPHESLSAFRLAHPADFPLAMQIYCI